MSDIFSDFCSLTHAPAIMWLCQVTCSLLGPVQARPHIEEAADKAGEAIEDAAHTVAINVEPAVKQATDLVKEKVGSAQQRTDCWLTQHGTISADNVCIMCRRGRSLEMQIALKPR